MAGPGAARHAASDACARWRVHVADAKDDIHAFGRPAPGADQPHDAMDNAADVRRFHHELSQRLGAVLGCIQPGRDDNTGLCDGLETAH